jgi:geranylgeranyl transferase type-2 subunit beta
VSSSARYAGTLMPAGADLISIFNRLNIARILKRCAIATSVAPAALSPRVLDVLLAEVQQRRIGAYRAFLACLCLQMTGVALPCAGELCQLIATLRRADGGYAESSVGPSGQTNSTAAAVAVMQMCGSIDATRSDAAAQFLAAMQSSDGGLMAHGQAGAGDLLSTFTGLLTLWSLERIDQIDLASVARFLRSVAVSTGGFRATVDDPETDPEYTWYGLATLSLLRLWGRVAAMD